MKRRLSAFAAIAMAAGLLMWGLNSPQRTDAMPPFAEAEGQNCTLCHTMMPGLNAYGRYILRTFYGAITWDTFHGTSPVWLNYTISGRSTGKLDPRAPAFKETWGNLSADASGLAGKWSYRFEQSIYSNDQSGGSLGNAWIAYDDILKGDMQARVGRFSRPVAAVFSNNWYRSNFAMTGVTVGNHVYSLTGSGWGGELSYEHGYFTGEAGIFEQGNNLPNSASFSTLPGTQRSVSYQFAYAKPTSPLEVGMYGSTGTYTQKAPAYPQDQFTGNGVYLMRDAQPRTYVPGVAIIYQVTEDNNPGFVKKVSLQPENSYATALQLEEPLFNGRAMIGGRREIINSPTTGIASGTVLDAGVQIPHIPYLFLYGEAAMGSAYTNATFGRPTWRWQLRWAGPVVGPLTKTEK